MATAPCEGSDRLSELQKFDATKRGVKGLLDAGVTSLPPLFIHPPDTRPRPGELVPSAIPTIDLSRPRKAVAEEVSRACREVGFFMVVNHGVPQEVLDRTIGSVRAFHEMPAEAKERFYTREVPGNGVSYLSNVDLYRARAASWRDTIQIRLGPTLPELEDIPEICRNEVIEWKQHCTRVAELLMELMCEGLGLDAGRLKEMTCSEGQMMVGHYYPWCPQPDLTFGLGGHKDPGVLTVVLQDNVGGLQVLCDETWVEVKPVPGSLVINVGDILQMMSNDEYKSVEHRVLANHTREPRISIGVFFNPGNRDSLYGPFPELVSPEKPALYKQFGLIDYMKAFFGRELGEKSVKDRFKP